MSVNLDLKIKQNLNYEIKQNLSFKIKENSIFEILQNKISILKNQNMNLWWPLWTNFSLERNKIRISKLNRIAVSK